MIRYAKELLSIAKDVIPDIEYEFVLGEDYRILDEIFSNFNRYISRIKHNEGFETTLVRYDGDDSMIVGVGISDHPHKEAILRELDKYVKGMAKKLNVEMREDYVY